jgi:hypothetical protein
VTVAHVRAGASEAAQLVFEYSYPPDAAPCTAAPTHAPRPGAAAVTQPAAASPAAATPQPSLRPAAAGGANVSGVVRLDGSVHADSNSTETYARGLVASVAVSVTSVPVRRCSRRAMHEPLLHVAYRVACGSRLLQRVLCLATVGGWMVHARVFVLCYAVHVWPTHRTPHARTRTKSHQSHSRRLLTDRFRFRL